jgi:hypothetical protein
LVLIGAGFAALGALGDFKYVTYLGALLAAAGAAAAARDQNDSNNKLEQKNEKILELTEKIAGSVTGGSTVCYLMPSLSRDGAAYQSLVSVGEFPIYDMTMRVVDLDLESATSQKPSVKSLMQEKVYGPLNMSPSSAHLMGSILHIRDESGRWNIFFAARNGFFHQLLRLRKVEEKWSVATRVQRDSKIVFEKVGTDYPKNPDGTVDWK